MASKSPYRAPHDLTHEHTLLRDLLDQITRLLGERAASQSNVITALTNLKEEVLEHFEHEESGGYFQNVVDTAPRLKDQTDALLQQHPEFAAQLNRLQQLAAEKFPTDSWWQALSQEFDNFVRTFQEHEHAENSLLYEAFERDIGTDD